MNSYVEKLDRDLFAVNFDLVAKGLVDGIHFNDTSEEATNEIVTISEDGYFIINKSSDETAFRNSIDFVRAIMQLNLSDINTERGFCMWIRGISSRLEKYSDEPILKLRTVDPYKKFWTVYQNLCAAEIKRRKLRKEWILNHPLAFLNEFINEERSE